MKLQHKIMIQNNLVIELWYIIYPSLCVYEHIWQQIFAITLRRKTELLFNKIHFEQKHNAYIFLQWHQVLDVTQTWLSNKITVSKLLSVRRNYTGTEELQLLCKVPSISLYKRGKICSHVYVNIPKHSSSMRNCIKRLVSHT